MMYEGMSTLQWAKQQLHGVLCENDPQYRETLYRIGFIFLDCTEMQFAEQRGWQYTEFASDLEAKSWSWLV
jgi:hypothetical protein